MFATDNEERTLSESEKNEVMEFLGQTEQARYQFPQLSHDGLNALRDILGTHDFQRIEAKGLSESDAYWHSKAVAYGVCSIILNTRLIGGNDPLSIALTALTVGYERGIRDALRSRLSPEGMHTLIEKVEREEEGGREVEKFRRELEEL